MDYKQYLRIREKFLSILIDENLTVNNSMEYVSIFLFGIATNHTDSINEAKILLNHYFESHMKTLNDPDTEEFFQHTRQKQKKEKETNQSGSNLN